MSLFAIRARRDLVYKPAIMIGLIILGAELTTRSLIPGVASDVWIRILVILIVAVPPVGLIFYALTHLHRVQDQLALIAATDMLTGLHNRHAFFDRTRQAQARDTGGVLFAIDADHFKQINDTYGHAAGDICLRAIADRLRCELRKGDIVGRVGGEEFAAYLPDAPMEVAERIGARLVSAIEVELEQAKTSVTVTLSIGAAAIDPSRRVDEVLLLADKALYHAKALGRARMVIWADGLAAGPAATSLLPLRAG